MSSKGIGTDPLSDSTTSERCCALMVQGLCMQIVLFGMCRLNRNVTCYNDTYVQGVAYHLGKCYRSKTMMPFFVAFAYCTIWGNVTGQRLSQMDKAKTIHCTIWGNVTGQRPRPLAKPERPKLYHLGKCYLSKTGAKDYAALTKLYHLGKCYRSKTALRSVPEVC